MSSEKRALVGQLRSYPTFEPCSRDDVAALVDAGTVATLPANWAMVQEGTPSDACYVILTGSVRVFRDRGVIAELGPGDVVGEMTLFGGGQRRATVSSTSSVRVLRIENAVLTDLLARREGLHTAFLAVQARHSEPEPSL